MFQQMFEASGKAVGKKAAESGNAARGKKLHDLLAGLAAIDPRATGCGWRRVNQRWSKTENQKLLAADGRAKNGGEWVCVYAVGEEVSNPQRQPEEEDPVVDQASVLEKAFTSAMTAAYQDETWNISSTCADGSEYAYHLYEQMEANMWNAWITVSIDYDLFAENLAGI